MENICTPTWSTYFHSCLFYHSDVECMLPEIAIVCLVKHMFMSHH